MKETDVVDIKILLKIPKNESKNIPVKIKYVPQASPELYHLTKKATWTPRTSSFTAALWKLAKQDVGMVDLNSNLTLKLQPLTNFILLPKNS